MQKEIYRIQHPKNCSDARFMYCEIPNNCGAACNIHQMVYCFYVAFATQRTMVLGGQWQYLSQCTPNAGEWHCFFEPVTDCKLPLHFNPEYVPPWSPDEESKGSKWTKIDLFIRGMGIEFVKWATSDGDHSDVPVWLPHVIAPKLRKYHYEIVKWMVGQFASYLLRVNPNTQSHLEKLNSNITATFQNNRPKIGIHVRRTDKVSGPSKEAEPVELSKYVDRANLFLDEFVPQWRNDESLKPIIYLATDEVEVYREALAKYTDYTWAIFTDGEFVSGQLNDRTSLRHTYGLISDLYFLSRCDFFIGTWSSQVSRLVSELFQSTHLTGTERDVSVDDVYYFP